MERIYIKYEPNNNLPTHKIFSLTRDIRRAKKLESAVCVTNKSNHNLNLSQKEILIWHFILVHIGFQHVQWLICSGHLKVQGHFKAVVNCESPKCAACEFVNGHICSNKLNTINNYPMKDKDLKKDHLLPGHMMFADNYTLQDPDRLYHTKGK